MEGFFFALDVSMGQDSAPTPHQQVGIFGLGLRMANEFSNFATHPETTTNLQIITNAAVRSITTSTVASYRFKAHPKLLATTDTLIPLYNSLIDASNKKSLLKALTQSIVSLEQLSSLTPENFGRIFLVRSEGDSFTAIQEPAKSALRQQISEFTTQLRNYRRILNGEDRTVRTESDLTQMREAIITALAGSPNNNEYDNYVANFTLPEEPTGLLTKLLKYIAQREGVLANGVREAANYFLDTLVTRITGSGAPTNDRVDLPPYQLLNGKEVWNLPRLPKLALIIKDLWLRFLALLQAVINFLHL
jgi:hypothetical protein